MTTKSMDNLPTLPLNGGEPVSSDCNVNKGFVFDHAMFDTEDVSLLQSILTASCRVNFDPAFKDSTLEEGFTKSASVKFMITLQDESDLAALGYSKAEIDKLKPQEAADILNAGTKAELAIDRE